jgi:hypothetical protein
MADRTEAARPMVQEATVAAGGQAPGSRVPRDVRTLRRIVLHPVSVVLDIRLLDILAFALLVAGCAAAARAVLTTTNDAWELPPLSVHGAAQTKVPARSTLERSATPMATP